MNERLQRMINHPLSLPAAVGVGSFAIGVGLGYLLGKSSATVIIEADKKEDDQPDPNFKATLADLQVVEGGGVTISPDHPAVNKKTAWEKAQEERPDPGDIVVDYEELERLRAEREERESEDDIQAPGIRAVKLSSERDEWDWNIELSLRNDHEPYVLHQDEFHSDEEPVLDQTTLTYYEGDDILVDSHETPIYNYHKLVGDLRFGHGSSDQNVVYVRNPAVKAEYEILKDEGHYAIEVLGLEADESTDEELRHAHIPKFRWDD